jgi:TolB protein
MAEQAPEYKAFYANSYALLIGIDSYADPNFAVLSGAEKDAKELGALLAGDPFNFAVTTLLGAQATRQALLQALHNLRSAGPDDRIVVFFSGHGYAIPDNFGKETGYLAAYDTQAQQDFTAVEMDEVSALRLHAKAKHIGFIFDCCFSGQALGLTRAVSTPSLAAQKFLTRRAYQAISAGTETVADYKSMTRYIIAALKEAHVNSATGAYTLSALGLHLKDAMGNSTGHIQIPEFGHLEGSSGGDLILWLDNTPRLPEELEDALHASRANTRLGAVVDLIEMTRGDDRELAKRARARLEAIRDADPDKKVREAAESFFNEEKAHRLAAVADGFLKEKYAKGIEERVEEQVQEAEDAREIKVSVGLYDKEASDAIPTDQFKARAIEEQKARTTRGVDVAKITAAGAPAGLKSLPVWVWGAIGVVAVALIGGGMLAMGGFGAAGATATPTLAPVVQVTIAPSSTPTESPTLLPGVTAAPTLIGGGKGMIAFTSAKDGDNDIYLLDAQTGAVTALTSNTADDQEPTFSPDGTKMAFASDRKGNLDIYSMELATGTVTQLTDSPSRDYSPKWSPDGKSIAFISERRAGQQDIYVMQADGNFELRVTDSNAPEYSPAWSPDSRMLAYVSERDGNAEIYRVGSDSTNPVRLTNTAENEASPSWSPDGSKIVYAIKSGSSDGLKIMDINGIPQAILNGGRGSAVEAAWSPDGSLIAFIATWDGNRELYTVRPDGSELRNRSKSNSSEFTPSWSTDGQFILFTSDRNVSLDIFMIRSDGSSQRQLTENSGNDQFPAWQP